MTSGEPPTGPSAFKVGGYALVGVGALAAVFGVATLASGGAHDTAQGPEAPGKPPVSSMVSEPPPESSAPEPVRPPESSRPPAASRPPAPPEETTVRTPSPQPPPRLPPQPPEQQPPGQPRPDVPDRPADRQVVLRVYNNSMIRDLAHRAAADFREAGYTVAEIGNYSGGRIATTTVYYRPGTPEQAQAEVVARRFGARLEPRFPGIEKASPGVIAIVTKDYDGPEPGK